MTSEGQGRLVVYARSQGRCELCSRPASEWHHRLNRSQGGTWDPANGLHLCRQCHQWITEHPRHAAPLGLTLPRGAEPARWPVWLHPTMWWRGWWLPDDAGCWTWDHARSMHDHPPADVAAAIDACASARRLKLAA